MPPRVLHPLYCYRTSHGLTQPQLAKRLKLTNGYISILERGIQPPGPQLAKRIEKELGIPKEQLRPDLWE